MEKLKQIKCLNASHLKIIAMVCMLIDHAWAMLVSGNLWMTCVGRIAFPIFAFTLGLEISAPTRYIFNIVPRFF